MYDGLFRLPLINLLTMEQRELDMRAIAVAVLDYIVEHPGAMCGPPERRTFTDAFRAFIISMTAPGHPGDKMPLADLEYVTGVPQETLKAWLCRS